MLVLDEAVNANFIGVRESRSLADATKRGLECHVIVQDPFTFPSEEIRRNVLQNTGRHEWFRQGGAEAARLAAEDIATPLLDPLRVHHTKYRVRSVAAGFDRVQTSNSSDWTDTHGSTTRRGRSWKTVFRPRHRDIKDAQQRYTPLADQILLMQKELMLQRPGYRLVRNGKISKDPEYVPMLVRSLPRLDQFWSLPSRRPTNAAPQTDFDTILDNLKRKAEYRAPAHGTFPVTRSNSQSAAGRLTSLGKT